MNVADAVSRRVNVVGPVQPTRMQETEAFRKGEGVTASGIQAHNKKGPPSLADRGPLLLCAPDALHAPGYLGHPSLQRVTGRSMNSVVHIVSSSFHGIFVPSFRLTT